MSSMLTQYARIYAFLFYHFRFSYSLYSCEIKKRGKTTIFLLLFLCVESHSPQLHSTERHTNIQLYNNHLFFWKHVYFLLKSRKIEKYHDRNTSFHLGGSEKVQNLVIIPSFVKNKYKRDFFIFIFCYSSPTKSKRVELGPSDPDR